MSPLRRELGQRFEHERPSVQARVWKLQTRSANKDTLSAGEQVEVEHSCRVRRAADTTELRLDRMEYIEQSLWLQVRVNVENAIHIFRLIGRRNGRTAVPPRATANNDADRGQYPYRGPHDRQWRAMCLAREIAADRYENIFSAHWRALAVMQQVSYVLLRVRCPIDVLADHGRPRCRSATTAVVPTRNPNNAEGYSR